MEKFWAGLIGVIVGGFISTWREWWMDKRNKNKDAKYLAIRIVCILDKFINHCLDVVTDDGTYHGQRDEHGELRIQVHTPNLEFDSLNVNWNSISADLMYRILSLPNKIYLSNLKIESSWEEYGGYMDEVIPERQSEYAALGLEAFRIVEKLCKKYHIKENIHDRDSYTISRMKEHTNENSDSM